MSIPLFPLVFKCFLDLQKQGCRKQVPFTFPGNKNADIIKTSREHRAKDILKTRIELAILNTFLRIKRIDGAVCFLFL
jgi:hypothetical protein